MKKGRLILIATPIDDETILHPKAIEIIEKSLANGAAIFVEELKECRRRWLRYGLERSHIEDFKLYNEHTYNDASSEAISILKKGTDVLLMSDCGLPAFCDPGRSLVERCHLSGITVTASPFENSIALAISLSGFPHDRFVFEGFLPVDAQKRSKSLERIVKAHEVAVIMDTPYRMKKLIDELDKTTAKFNCSREVFIGMNLNSSQEKLYRGTPKKLNSILEKSKEEFVMVLGPKHTGKKR